MAKARANLPCGCTLGELAGRLIEVGFVSGEDAEALLE